MFFCQNPGLERLHLLMHSSKVVEFNLVGNLAKEVPALLSIHTRLTFLIILNASQSCGQLIFFW